jgi:hypothetical protein
MASARTSSGNWVVTQSSSHLSSIGQYPRWNAVSPSLVYCPVSVTFDHVFAGHHLSSCTNSVSIFQLFISLIYCPYLRMSKACRRCGRQPRASQELSDILDACAASQPVSEISLRVPIQQAGNGNRYMSTDLTIAQWTWS